MLRVGMDVRRMARTVRWPHSTPSALSSFCSHYPWGVRICSQVSGEWSSQAKQMIGSRMCDTQNHPLNGLKMHIESVSYVTIPATTIHQDTVEPADYLSATSPEPPHPSQSASPEVPHPPQVPVSFEEPPVPLQRPHFIFLLPLHFVHVAIVAKWVV